MHVFYKVLLEVLEVSEVLGCQFVASVELVVLALVGEELVGASVLILNL